MVRDISFVFVFVLRRFSCSVRVGFSLWLRVGGEEDVVGGFVLFLYGLGVICLCSVIRINDLWF